MISRFRQKRSGESLQRQFFNYLSYATGEIFLVVVGILIALQINNWNNRRIEHMTATKIYHDIRKQIVEDEKELQQIRGMNLYFFRSYEYASDILKRHDEQKTDTLAYLSMGMSQFSDFRRNSNIYETLVNSGALKLLRNDTVIQALQQLEMTYTHINQLEQIHWEVIINELSPVMRGTINYATLEVVRPEQLFSVEMQNMLVESIYLTRAKDSVYAHALNEISALIASLNNEVN